MNKRKVFFTMAPIALATLVLLGSSPNPANAKVSKDKNHNGIPDSWELRYHLSIYRNLANTDPDRDGLTVKQEFYLGLNPVKADTDQDGIKDGNEDLDHDKLTNLQEYLVHTNPLNPDSDRDGIKDGNEDLDRDNLNNYRNL